VREEDLEPRSTQVELRDIHARLDKMEQDNRSQFAHFGDKLQALEVSLARGTRFPAAAWVATAALALTVLGSGAGLYGQMLVTQRIAQEAADAIKAHIIEMGPAESLVWKMEERIKALENRIVGQGPDGWHRRDHETYARMVEAQIGAVERRLQTVEHLQAALCERVRQCK